HTYYAGSANSAMFNFAGTTIQMQDFDPTTGNPQRTRSWQYNSDGSPRNVSDVQYNADGSVANDYGYSFVSDGTSSETQISVNFPPDGVPIPNSLERGWDNFTHKPFDSGPASGWFYNDAQYNSSSQVVSRRDWGQSRADDGSGA